MSPGVQRFGKECSSSSSQGCVFLQDRIALFSKTMFLLSMFFYVARRILLLFFQPVLGHTWSPFDTWHVIGMLMSLLTWLIVRRPRTEVRGARAGASLPMVTLRAIDVGTVFLMIGAYAIMLSHDPRAIIERTDRVVMLITILVLVVHSVLVPSTLRHTILVSAIGSVPALSYAFVLFAMQPRDVLPYAPGLVPGYTFVWCLATMLMAGLTSRVIYGLRAEVAEAQRLGQYLLEHKIGEGGMGAVYRARHALLRRPTAIKLVLPEKAGVDALVRFEREVQLTAMLTHPNTVSVFDYGRTPDGIFYYAMEFLDGINLEQLVSLFGPLEPSRVVHVLNQVCGSLAEAHAVGLVHRDIKPGNIVLCERGGIADTAKVVDFGLVKDLGVLEGLGNVSLSNVNTLVGTPQYMAPELLLSPEKIDGRADLYSLGAVAYFLLTGAPVFKGTSVVEICASHLHEKPEPPSQRLGTPVPKDLEDAILWCLAKSPEHRPADATALRSILRACNIPEWTSAQAGAWWTRHGLEARSTPVPSGDSHSGANTLAIDLAARTAVV